MFGNIRLKSTARQKPVARTAGVGQRFLRGERLRCNNKKCRFCRHFGQRAFERCAIDVRNEVQGKSWMHKRAQRLAHHLRAQVGTTDADVDDVGDLKARAAAPLAFANLRSEVAHLRQHALHFVSNVHAVQYVLARTTRRIAQRHVQDGAVFAQVDTLSGHHRVAKICHVALSCERQQPSHRLLSNQVF